MDWWIRGFVFFDVTNRLYVASTWKIEWNVRIPWKSALTDHKFLQIMRKLSIFLLSWSPLITHVIFRDHSEVCSLKEFGVFNKKGQRLAWVIFQKKNIKHLHVLNMLLVFFSEYWNGYSVVELRNILQQIFIYWFEPKN